MRGRDKWMYQTISWQTIFLQSKEVAKKQNKRNGLLGKAEIIIHMGLRDRSKTVGLIFPAPLT